MSHPLFPPLSPPPSFLIPHLQSDLPHSQSLMQFPHRLHAQVLQASPPLLPFPPPTPTRPIHPSNHSSSHLQSDLPRAQRLMQFPHRLDPQVLQALPGSVRSEGQEAQQGALGLDLALHALRHLELCCLPQVPAVTAPLLRC
ncbi:unnamed protein product [Closterium sp. NIES-54]